MNGLPACLTPRAAAAAVAGLLLALGLAACGGTGDDETLIEEEHEHIPRTPPKMPFSAGAQS